MDEVGAHRHVDLPAHCRILGYTVASSAPVAAVEAVGTGGA
jgi:hypothetical protein